MEQTEQTPRQRVVNRDSSLNSDLKRCHSSESEDDTKQRKVEYSSPSTLSLPIPKFLIVRHKEEGRSLAKVSPFLIHKAFVGAGGEPAAIRKLRNGTILVEAKTERQAQKYLGMRSFYDQVEIVVEGHSSLNQSKGIVFSRELLECTVEEIKEELTSSFVTEVVRITRSENGVAKPTPGHILTFASPHPPTSIKAGYLSLSVRPYYRNPQRCYRCQKFGHSSKGCPNPEMCCRCGQTGHEAQDCTSEESCVNCRGKHAASSKNCKVYLEEREVLKICTDEKLSFVEARKLYKTRRVSTPRSATSYSEVAAAPPKPAQCSSCQVLEGMVRALTEQVSLLVAQLSASTKPIDATSQSHPAASKSVKPSAGSPAVVTKKSGPSPSTSTNTSAKTPYLKSAHAPARKGLTAEEGQALGKKLRSNIQHKADNRAKGNTMSPKSSVSSQASLLDEGMEEEQPTATPHRLKDNTLKNRSREKISFK